MLQSTGGRFIHGNVRTIAVADTVSLYAWTLRNGKLMDVLTGHNGPVCGVGFHPDESLPFVEEISPESDTIPSYRGLENFEISPIV